MTRISFEHRFDDELKMWVFTSPEVKGFRATGATLDEAERAAFAIMALIRRDRSDNVMTSVEYAEV